MRIKVWRHDIVARWRANRRLECVLDEHEQTHP